MEDFMKDALWYLGFLLAGYGAGGVVSGATNGSQT